MAENKKCGCPLCNRQFTPANGLSAKEHLAKSIVALYADMQKNLGNSEKLPCPRCGCNDMNLVFTENAVSRLADVRICDKCETHEDIQETHGKLSPLTKWPIVTQIMGMARSGANCGDYTPEIDNPYPLCDNLGCVESHRCNISAHMDENGMYPGE